MSTKSLNCNFQFYSEINDNATKLQKNLVDLKIFALLLPLHTESMTLRTSCVLVLKKLFATSRNIKVIG